MGSQRESTQGPIRNEWLTTKGCFFIYSSDHNAGRQSENDINLHAQFIVIHVELDTWY